MYSIHSKTCHNSTHADLACKMSTKTNKDFQTKVFNILTLEILKCSSWTTIERPMIWMQSMTLGQQVSFMYCMFQNQAYHLHVEAKNFQVPCTF